MASWLVRKTPRALTAKLKSQSSSVRSTTRSHARYAGIGAEDVVAAESRLDCGKACLDAGAIADVDAKAAGAIAEFGGEVARSGLVEIGDGNAHAFGGESPADRPADAPCGTRHDSALVREAGKHRSLSVNDHYRSL